MKNKKCEQNCKVEKQHNVNRRSSQVCLYSLCLCAYFNHGADGSRYEDKQAGLLVKQIEENHYGAETSPEHWENKTKHANMTSCTVTALPQLQLVEILILKSTVSKHHIIFCPHGCYRRLTVLKLAENYSESLSCSSVDLFLTQLWGKYCSAAYCRWLDLSITSQKSM